MHTNIREKKGYWHTYGFIPGLDSGTTSVLVVRPQEIWLGTESGVAVWDGRRYRIITEREGLPDRHVRYLFKDSLHNVWICTASGLARDNGERIVSFSESDGIPPGFIPLVEESPDGSIWVPVCGKGIYRYDGAGFSLFEGSEGLERKRITDLLPERDGVWVATLDGLFFHDGSGFREISGDFPLPSQRIRKLFRDSGGSLWIGTERGLVYSGPSGSVRFTKSSGFDITDIRMIEEDGDHNIWIGSYRQGVDCYSGGSFVSFRTRDGLASDTVMGMSQEENGTYWFACRFGGFSSYNPYDVEPLSDDAINEVFYRSRSKRFWWGAENSLATFEKDRVIRYPFPSSVLDILEDSSGRLWVSTLSDGVYMYPSKEPAGHRPKHFTPRDGLTCREVWMLWEDSRGRIWMGSADGLFIFTDRIERHISAGDGLCPPLVSAFAEDTLGNIWIGGWQGGGLSIYRNDTVEPFEHNQKLPAGAVVDLLAEQDGTLWIGTIGGLFTLKDGELSPCFPGDDVPGRRIQRIKRGRSGRLYISTLGGGLICHDGQNYQVLTSADHLPSDCVTGCIEDDDGTLVISTFRGMVRFRPDYTRAPGIRIDELIANRVYRNPVDLSIGGQDIPIIIRYHGACTRSTRMRYLYSLEGYDDGWISTWGEEVRYENLPQGNYTFRVRALNRDLVASPVAEVRFSLLMETHDRIITDLKETVAERTRELEDALHRLEQLNHHLRIMSLQDELTGLYNRRGFLTLGKQHFKHALRTREPFLVCFADMDGLKQINDSFGHDEGDEAIRKTADVLRYTFRDEDILARLGGDEFTVLVSGAGLEDFPSVRERLDRCLARFNSRSGKPYRLGVSMGAAAFVPDRTRSLEDLMTEADTILYGEKQAKKSASASRLN